MTSKTPPDDSNTTDNDALDLNAADLDAADFTEAELQEAEALATLLSHQQSFELSAEAQTRGRPALLLHLEQHLDQRAVQEPPKASLPPASESASVKGRSTVVRGPWPYWAPLPLAAAAGLLFVLRTGAALDPPDSEQRADSGQRAESEPGAVSTPGAEKMLVQQKVGLEQARRDLARAEATALAQRLSNPTGPSSAEGGAPLRSKAERLNGPKPGELELALSSYRGQLLAALEDNR